MNRISLLVCCVLSVAAITASSAAPSSLSVEQIIEKNVAARGGLAAWRAVNTMTTEGKMDAGGKPNHELPFVLRQKRPNKSRLEIVFKDQTSVQVYDGTHGWKVRPFLNRNDAEPYTEAETKLAAAAADLDGPLIDYASKGTKVALIGNEAVEGHSAYKLLVTLRNGEKRNVWVDSSSFLELKMDGEPRKLDGRMHKVAIFFRDYKPEHGLSVAHLQESAVEGVKQTYKMTLAKVVVNEAMSDSLFQKPQPAVAAAAASAVPGAKTH